MKWFRSVPEVAVVITCMGRSFHLKKSLPLFLDQNYSHFKIIVVDWSSPDDLREYLASMECPNLDSFSIQGRQYFHLSAARNAGAEYAVKKYQPDLIFFTDCDILIPDNFLLRNVLQYQHFKKKAGWFRDVFLHSKKLDDGSFDIWGSCLVPTKQWKKWKYNETIDTYGHEDNEFYNCMREHRCKNQTLIVDSVKSIKHDDSLRMQYYKDSPEDMRRIRLANKDKFRFHGHFDT